MNKNKLYIKYRLGGKEYINDLYQTQHYFIEDTSTTNELNIKIIPREKIELIAFEMRYSYPFGEEDKIFANGYQSWTTSQEYSRHDKMKGLSYLFKVLPMFSTLAATSGDYKFQNYSRKAGVFHSYTYTYIRKDDEFELWGSLSERQGFTVFHFDMKEHKFVIQKDVEGLTIDAPYQIFNIVKYVGKYDEVFDNYFNAMQLPKTRLDHLAGYTSWYNYFQKIDENIILRDLKGLTRVKESATIFQIDDGYQPYVGDWLDDNKQDFPSGMKHIADSVHNEGFLAGLWLAPFNVQRNSRIAATHPDWLIKKANGKPSLGCVGWGGAYTLDIYNADAREYIKSVFDVVLNKWGFDMVKLDFLYSQCMEPRNNKTRGTIMCEAMEFLRECVGDKLLLGCGVPLGASFGYVDACRISCDVDLKYKGKLYNKLHINREIPSAQNAMLNTMFRRHLDKRAFCNDPDVFFLRDFNLTFTMEQKLLLARINNLFGSVLFVSDDVGQYGDKEIEIIKKAFAKSDTSVMSVDISHTNIVDVVYLENGKRKKLTFNLATGEHNLDW